MRYFMVCANSDFWSSLVEDLNNKSYVCEFKTLKMAREYMKELTKRAKEYLHSEYYKWELKRGNNTITIDVEEYNVPKDYDCGTDCVGNYEFVRVADSRYVMGRY